MTWKLCRECGQPMLPKGHKKKPGEFDHASGCPRADKRGHWFGELAGQDAGLIECEYCYMTVEARRLKEFAGKACPNDKIEGCGECGNCDEGIFPCRKNKPAALKEPHDPLP